VLVAECEECPGPVSVAVADDRRVELVGRVDHAAAVVARAVELVPEVLVVDESVPGGAIAAAVEIEARLPGTHLVVIHGPDDDGLVEALAAGALAYVSRTSEPKELVDAIIEVARGEVVLSRRQVALIVGELRDPTRPRRRLERMPELTAREWQVFELMHSDLSTPEIAERLVVSPITVRSHARSIRNKLERKGRLSSLGAAPRSRHAASPMTEHQAGVAALGVRGVGQRQRSGPTA
jgi:DNA-binding NarL/FixJ family response regulator